MLTRNLHRMAIVVHKNLFPEHDGGDKGRNYCFDDSDVSSSKDDEIANFDLS